MCHPPGGGDVRGLRGRRAGGDAISTAEGQAEQYRRRFLTGDWWWIDRTGRLLLLFFMRLFSNQ